MRSCDLVRAFVASVLIASVSDAQTPAMDRVDSLIRIHRHRTPEWVAQDRNMLLHEARPALRGFRARILQDDARELDYQPWPMLMPGAERSHPVWRSADLVAHRLAHDGLLMTLAEVLRIWHAPEASGYQIPFERDKIGWLRGAGLPVDLLSCFSSPNGSTPANESSPATGSILPSESIHAANAIIEDIERRLAAGATSESLQADLARIPFRFRASAPGFRVATESGENEIALVRVQLTSGTYWSGKGDGGCLDLVRQAVELLPQASFIASIEEKHVDRFLETARDWPIARANRFTLLPESLPVAQWAQDNGKPGWIESADKASRAIVTLVPRYASRGEDGAIFVPGETFLMDGVAADGQRVVQSPLLFQGGNLIAVRHPRSGERILFIGEAEIYRNTALGLSRDQVLDAFRIELGVDRCIVLPAVSFHVDCEMCVRGVGTDLVAFVNDEPAAARIAFDCGLEGLEKHAHMDASAARAARSKLASGRTSEAIEAATGALLPQLKGPGRFSETFAQSFSTAPWDSGVGNLETFLLALDLLQSETVRAQATAIDPNTAAYLDSLRRRDADRALLVKALASEGCQIVRVPSFSDGDRGINYVNGIHARGIYLMPSQSGFYSALDRAAQFVFETAVGTEAKVLPLQSSESQRRSGAVHCSFSVYAGP